MREQKVSDLRVSTWGEHPFLHTFSRIHSHGRHTLFHAPFFSATLSPTLNAHKHTSHYNKKIRAIRKTVHVPHFAERTKGARAQHRPCARTPLRTISHTSHRTQIPYTTLHGAYKCARTLVNLIHSSLSPSLTPSTSLPSISLKHCSPYRLFQGLSFFHF